MSKLFEEMFQVFGFGGDDIMGTRRAGFKQRREERRQKALKRAELMSASANGGKTKANTAVTVYLPKVEDVSKINLTEFQVGIYKEYRDQIKDGQRKYEVNKLINNNNNKNSKEIDDNIYGIGRVAWEEWMAHWD